jgi:hypothetical protein
MNRSIYHSVDQPGLKKHQVSKREILPHVSDKVKIQLGSTDLSPSSFNQTSIRFGAPQRSQFVSVDRTLNPSPSN